jgi:hypothetical protein
MGSEKEIAKMGTSVMAKPSRSSPHGNPDEALAIDPIAERRLVRKLDLIVYPTFFIIYMMSFLDRINISNAKIQGLVEDLELYGNRFNVALFVSIHLEPHVAQTHLYS